VRIVTLEEGEHLIALELHTHRAADEDTEIGTVLMALNTMELNRIENRATQSGHVLPGYAAEAYAGPFRVMIRVIT